MRCHVKKKRYKMHCREQTLAGLKSQPGGQWAMSGGADGVNHNVLAGTQGAEPGVGRPRKGGCVKPHPEHYAAYTGPKNGS